MAVAANPEVVEIFTELEHNLQRLALDIPEIGVNDIHILCQRHAVGVGGLLRRFLRRVACAVVFYHEHHHA